MDETETCGDCKNFMKMNNDSVSVSLTETLFPSVESELENETTMPTTRMTIPDRILPTDPPDTPPLEVIKNSLFIPSLRIIIKFLPCPSSQ